MAYRSRVNFEYELRTTMNAYVFGQTLLRRKTMLDRDVEHEIRASVNL